MNRKNKNVFGTRKIPPSDDLENSDRMQLRHSPIALNAEMRRVVKGAIENVCGYRCYRLFALQARTNHVHLVVSGNRKPEFLMNSFKAYATRALREHGLVENSMRVWSRHGSTRYLWTEDHIAESVDYVVNGQGYELPNFD